jgi:hypothetical protein
MLYEAAIANSIGGNSTLHDLRAMIVLSEFIATGVELTESAVTNVFSKITLNRNCAIRAIPCGLYNSFKDVDAASTTQAKATLCSEETILASRVAASMAWYFHTTIRPKNELGSFVDDLFPGQGFDVPYNKPVISPINVAHAAISLIVSCGSRMGILRDCMKFTGEIRKVAILACATSAPCHELSHDWPQHICDQLQNKVYMLDLDKKLISPGKIEPEMIPWKLAPTRPEFLKEIDYVKRLQETRHLS